MYHKPKHPSEETAELHLAEFGNGTVATHSGHRTEVLVAERLHFLAGLKALEILCQKVALLNGHLGKLRMTAVPFVVALRHNALVANGEHAVETLHAVKGVYHDATSTAEMARVKVAHRLSCHTAHPNKRTGGNGTAVLQHDAVVLVVGNHLVEKHVHAHRAQILLHLGRRVGIHGSKEARSGFYEVDVHERRGKVGIILRKHEVLHFRKCTGYFHTRGTTAHDNHVEQFLTFLVGSASKGAFEVVEKRIAESHGLAHVFHRHGFCSHVIVAEEIGGSAGSQHEVVVVDLTDGSLDYFVFGKDGAHLGHAKKEVLALLEDFAERKRNAAGFDTSRSNLVNEGRKLVVVVAVNEYHLEIAFAQFVGKLQTAEATAYDYHSLLFSLGKIETHAFSK